MLFRPSVSLVGALAALMAIGAHEAVADCLTSELVGRVTHVRDGDTIEVAGLPIRLDGWPRRS